MKKDFSLLSKPIIVTPTSNCPEMNTIDCR